VREVDRQPLPLARFSAGVSGASEQDRSANGTDAVPASGAVAYALELGYCERVGAESADGRRTLPWLVPTRGRVESGDLAWAG